MTVELAVLPDRYEVTICVGTSVRKNAAVLQHYLASLSWQELPPRTKVHYVFVDDGCDRAARSLLEEFVALRGGEILRGLPGAVGDFSDEHPATHQWSLSAMRRVGANKDRILRRALEIRADAVWLVDADLLLDTTTLSSLCAADKPIACAVYWTHWQKQAAETRQSHAAPQVWLRHPYQLDGRGQDEFEFRRKLLSRGLVRVWGQGACTLLRKHVIENGLNFSPLPEPQFQQGLMAGEDRQFCVKAERAHIEMWADTWPDIFHIYHLPNDLERIPDLSRRLSAAHPRTASLGCLVSARVTALEPLPGPNNTWHQAPTHSLRGRLGSVALLPELEEALYTLERGQERIVPVHVPLDYPVPYMRGKRRLLKVKLVDVKPYGFPPVISDELFVGAYSGKWQDSAALTEQQLVGLEEVATNG